MFHGNFLCGCLFAFSLATAWAKDSCGEIPDSIQYRLEQYWDSGFPAAQAQCVAGGWRVERGTGWVWAAAVQQPQGRTQPAVFTRLSRLEVGSPVVLADVPRSERFLARTGYFVPEGETRFYRIAQRNRLVPLMPLRDVAASRLEAMVAYDGTGSGWSGMLELDLKNLQGTARDFRFSAENNPEQRLGSVYYKEPMLLESPWDMVLQAHVFEADSLEERTAEMEGRYQADFEWQWIVGGGVGTRDWRSLLSVRYDDRDRLLLPTKGKQALLSIQLLGPRSGDTAQQRVWLEGSWNSLHSLSPHWAFRASAQGATLLPAWDYDRYYLRAVGGVDDFRALRPYSVYTRAYGLMEWDGQWRQIQGLVVHLFAQPGFYRARKPQQGWRRVWGYGLGWEQIGESWSVLLYYTLMQDLGLDQGLLNFSVRTYF